ncbi:MAG: sensor histidine kinase [Lactobacillus sp.]|jgi:signal transduction histidine kinase|nr:sensor histidine kinase [Lactobacillus sp.]
MTIKDYLLDHIPHTIFWVIGLLLLDISLWLIPNSPIPISYLVYVDVLLTVLYIIFLILVYFYRNRWYASLRNHLNLGQNALDIPLKGAQNHGQRFIQAHINQLLTYHHQQLDALISKEQDQQEFVESWVHDIKVPMAATKLLLDSGDLQIPPKAKQQLNQEWQQINHYVDQILYYSRLENFANDYLLREYHLRAIVVAVVKENMDYFFQKHIHLNVSDADAVVLTDEKWLTYILNQLLSNALKYTPEGGNIALTIRQDHGAVYLDVQDDGVGIPSEDLARIFDKGFTGTNGRLANQHATGLGLYLAQRLSDKLGHHLSVTSTVGAGSTFTISFPALNYYNEQLGEKALQVHNPQRFND